MGKYSAMFNALLKEVHDNPTGCLLDIIQGQDIADVFLNLGKAMEDAKEKASTHEELNKRCSFYVGCVELWTVAFRIGELVAEQKMEFHYKINDSSEEL